MALESLRLYSTSSQIDFFVIKNLFLLKNIYRLRGMIKMHIMPALTIICQSVARRVGRFVGWASRQQFHHSLGY